MAYFPFSKQNNGQRPTQQSDSDRTRRELNARKQLAKFDDHFNDPNTVVRLDSTYSSKNGNRKSRYIVSRNGADLYKAKFRRADNREKLVQVVSIKHIKKKPRKK